MNDDRTRSVVQTPTANQHSNPVTADAPQGTFAQTPDQVAALSAGAGVSEFPTIPGYLIYAKLGEGGMGVVFLARQDGLKRDVAVKMVLSEKVSRATVARFWAEAEVLAEVKHPNVVQVIELGEHMGRPFMAMEYVSGGSLAGKLRGGVWLPPMAAATLIEHVARGVAAAHDRGIIHRDLKPENVLMDGDTPKVADFGIAKRKTHELTQTKAMLGTPAYMSPEQAASQSRHVGPAADVWSLGVMLYECLSGKRPFDGESVFDVLAKIATEEPPPLRTWLGAVPRDLETIVAKCMTKEPELRYPTARELSDDLARFLRGEPVEARRLGTGERFARWVRRRPAAAAAYGFSSLAVLLAAVVFVIFGFWREAESAKRQLETANGQLSTEKKQTEQARDDAVKLRAIAEKAEASEKVARQTVQMFEYGRTIQMAYQEWQNGNLVRANALLERTDPKLRGWEWHYVYRICTGSLFTLKGHTAAVRSASWSTDGLRIVTASYDGTAKVWDAKTGDRLATLVGHTEWVMSASFSPDGLRIVTGGADFTAKVWDSQTGAELLTLTMPATHVHSAFWHRDGTQIITANGLVRVWDSRPLIEVLADQPYPLPKSKPSSLPKPR